MRIPRKKILLKNNLEIILRSAEASDAERMLEHLKITHRESYQNLNHSASYWDRITSEDEAKVLAEFENSKSKFMLIADCKGQIVEVFNELDC